MIAVELCKYWLPSPPHHPRSKPYLSTFRMDPEEAQRRGALRPEPGTRMVIQRAETPEEEAEIRQRTDTSKSGPSPC